MIREGVGVDSSGGEKGKRKGAGYRRVGMGRGSGGGWGLTVAGVVLGRGRGGRWGSMVVRGGEGV